MRIIIIAALTKKGIIGMEGKMPWHIPEELRHFKRETEGNAVIMGRKTYEAIGKALPHRLNIIVSSKRINSDEHIYFFDNLKDAFNFAERNKKDKIFVIGGASIFNQTIDTADELVLSFVKKEYEGDKYFPLKKLRLFEEFETEDHDEFTVKRYRRKNEPKR